METFNSFCRHTTLHGWQYMAEQSFTRLQKLFWGFIICVSFACATVLIYNNLLIFKNATVVTTVDTMTAPLDDIFFPSITVCNLNQARRSFFEEIGIYNNDTLIRQILSEYLGVDVDHRPGRSKRLPQNILDKLAKVAPANKSLDWAMHQKCRDMFVFSKWNGSMSEGAYDIDYDFGTDYGICCWFSPQLNLSQIREQFLKDHAASNKTIDENYRMGQMDIDGHWFANIPKGATTGKHNGFTMLVDIEAFDYNYSDEGAEGLKISLLHHLDIPLIRQTSFHIAPGTENQIAVTPTTTHTTYSALKRFNPDQRDCYTDDEISLQYLPSTSGYRYGMGNCLFESSFENILEKCKCYPGYNQGLVEDHNLGLKPCVGASLSCMNNILIRIGRFDHVNVNGEMMKCRSSCEDQVNAMYVTTSVFPNEKTFRYRESFCMMIPRLLEKCTGFKKRPLEKSYPNICSTLEPLRKIKENEYCIHQRWIPNNPLLNCSESRCAIEDVVHDYARKNLVMFHVLIKDPYSQRYRRDEKIAITSFIANLGGLLGLWLGFSWISGAEIVFHISRGIFSSISRRVKNENKDQRSKNSNHCSRSNTLELDPNGLRNSESVVPLRQSDSSNLT